VESWADDILGPESIGEYKAIFQKLVGTHTNHVFQAFRIEALQCIAAIRHQAVEEKRKKKKEKVEEVQLVSGDSAIAHLEQKKWKLCTKVNGSLKRTRVVDILFGSSSPLKAKGDSEDIVDVEPSPLAASPVTSALPA
jgi:hypothetical protein